MKILYDPIAEKADYVLARIIIFDESNKCLK